MNAHYEVKSARSIQWSRLVSTLFAFLLIVGIAPLAEAGTITGISVSQGSTETTATTSYTFTFTPATTINNSNWSDGAYFWFNFDDDYTVSGATLGSISPSIPGMAINNKNDTNGEIRMYTGNSSASIVGGQQYVVVLNGVQNPTTTQTPVNHQIRTGDGSSTIDTGTVAAAAITAAASNPPVVSSQIPDKSNLEESAGVTQYVANLNNHFSDSDGDTINYSASSSNSAIVAVTLSGTNNRTLSLQAKKWGSANITVTATTSDGSVQDVFNVTTIGQMPLAVAQGSAETTATTSYTFTFTPETTVNSGMWTDGAYFFFDLDDDYTVSGASLGSISPSITGMAINNKNNTTGTIRMYTNTGSITGGQEYTVVINGIQNPTTEQTPVDHEVRTGEGSGTIDRGKTAATAIAPAPTNPPVVSSEIPNKTNLGEVEGLVQYVADLNTYFTDSDGDTLTFSASSSDSTTVAVSLSGVNNKTLSLQAHKWGSANITVTATATDGAVQDVFNVTTIGLMTGGSVSQGSTGASASTTYSFTFTPDSTINSGNWCDGAYFFFNLDDDFTVSSASLQSITPAITGMAINFKYDAAGKIRMYTNSGSIVGGQEYTVVLNGVKNPPTSQTPDAHILSSGEGCGTVDYLSIAAAPITAVDNRGDFDGDGDSDIVWRNVSTGANGMWLMNSTTIVASDALPTVADLNLSMVATGDFNGDGRDDIAWRNGSTGENAVWLMNGSTVSTGALLPTIADTGLEIVGSGDFDGDGKDDILWRKNTDGSSAIWFMNGATVTTGAVLPVVSAPMDIVGVGDLNGDGKDDIIWRNSSTGDNAAWLMNGGTVMSGALLPNVAGLQMVIAGVGDFSGDGKADIFWRNTNTGENAMWLMNGASLATGVVLPDAATGFSVAAVGDYDLDGNSDIVFRDGSTGANAIWFMQASGLKSGAALPTVADTSSQIAGPK